MRPLIGLTGYFVDGSEFGKNTVRGLPGQDMAMVSYDYTRSIERAGGIPVILPIVEEDKIDSIIDKLDGLLLAGGADVNPLLYGETPRSYMMAVEEERDSFEMVLAKRTMERDLPIFGICRGLQVLNVVSGGTLYQDIEHELGSEYNHVHLQFRRWQGTHPIEIKKESKLYQIFNKEELMVNSFHHQAIKTLANDFIATAWSQNKIVEAIESKIHRHVFAVQWHPEMMSAKNELQQLLFNHFVSKIVEIN